MFQRVMSLFLAIVLVLTPMSGAFALETDATSGFLQVPQMAGEPTGVPGVGGSNASLVWDSTNKELRVRSGGAWNRMFGQDLKTTASPTFAGLTLTNNLTFTDNLYDIGASGATRPRTVYVGTSVVVPTVTATTLGGTLGTSSQPNVTALGTLTALTMGGTLTMGSNTLALANATVSGTPTWSSAQAILLSTAAQTNVTSLGTLSALTISGNLTLGSQVLGSASDVLHLSRTTNAQAFRVYNTTDSPTSPTNSEYFNVSWAANVLTLSAAKTGSGTVRAMVLDGASVTVTPNLLVKTGTGALPGIAFSANTDRGLTNDTTNNGLGLCAGGGQRLFISGTLAWFHSSVVVQVDGQLKAGAGTTTPAYSFAANTDRGICNDTTNNGVGIVVGASQKFFVGASVVWIPSVNFQTDAQSLIKEGTTASPGIAFTLHTNYGMYYDTGNSGVAFAINGGQRMFIGPTLVWVNNGANFQCDGNTTIVGSTTIRGTGTGNGQTIVINTSSELLTLATGATTTDTTANLLPATSIILSVTTRITTTITTATSWSVGDPTTATRFSSANATMTAGTTQVGINHTNGGVAAGAGMMQTAAAKVRITTNVNPGAGAVRITTHYITPTAPTS